MKENTLMPIKRRIKDVISPVIILILLLSLSWFFMQEASFNRHVIMYCSIVVVILSIILIVYGCCDIEFHRFSVLCLLLLGSISLFVQPILNMPDEDTHYARAEMVSRGILFIDPQQQTHETIQALYDLREDRQKPYSDSEIQGMKIDQTPAPIEHVASSNLFIVYIPQAIGIFLAKILNLNVIWSMWLGRLLNLICYSLIVGISLKLASGLQFPLFFVAALPMSVQQAASCSPDALINGSVFLIIGYFIYLYKKETVSWKNLLIFLLFGLLVITSKVTNVFFCGLILLLPLEKKLGRIKSILIKISFILLFIVCGVFYYIYTTQFPVSEAQRLYYASVGADSAGQIQYILSNMLEWVKNFGGSMIENVSSYVLMLNQYGCLDYDYYISSIIMVIAFGKICYQQRGLLMSVFNKVLLILMMLGNYCFTCLALYITWTPVGSTNIEGVQGRYFIPLIALLVVFLTGKGDSGKNKEKHRSDMVIVLAMVGAMLIKTITYYY